MKIATFALYKIIDNYYLIEIQPFIIPKDYFCLVGYSGRML